MKRGPKSAAELTVVTPIGAARPQPPDDLTETQAEVWRNVVDRLPAGWFPRETHDLLAAYCRHVVTHRYISRMIDACETSTLSSDDALADFGKILGLRDREAKAMVAIGRSLRITKASQTRPETAYRAASNNPEGKPRPWERTA